MYTKPILRMGLVALFLTLTFNMSALAQEQREEQRAAPAAEEGMPMGGGSSDMQSMAQAMESMADMCRMMMQREMQYKPYLMAAGAVVAALLVVALVLLIVLQVQCIRYLSVRVRAERQKLP